MTEDSVAELAQQQPVRSIRSAKDLAEPGMFDSDEELDEFLLDLAALRRTGMEPWLAMLPR